MHMKKYLFLFAIVLLAGCADQLTIDEYMDRRTEVAPTNEFQILMDKAKWGDGQAYLKLADCYRDGIGVKKDFIGMLSMASLADDYGGINRMEEYLDSLPKDSEYKLLIDCIEKMEHKQTEEAQALLGRIEANGTPEGLAIRGIYVLEQGDSIESRHLLEMAAENGSSFAELLLCIADWREAMNPSIEKLAAMIDKVPWTCNVLAETYIGKRGYGVKDNAMAAYYYLEADKRSCLTKSGARWLLNYLRDGGNLNMRAKDLERLQILADEDLIVAVDTVDVQ
jgi:TPR repeat protein